MGTGSTAGDAHAGRQRIPADSVIRRPVDRRTFLNWTSRSTLAGLAMVGGFGSVVAACTDGNGDGQPRTDGTDDGDLSNLPSTLTVGVIVPQSGLGQFLGEIVDRSLDAALKHIERESLFKGVKVRYRIINAPAEQLTDATSKAYTQLVSDPDVVGILWCTPIGLREARAQIARDQIPIIAVFSDLWSEGELYPDGPERSIFQMLLPDRMSIDHLMKYVSEDRGYTSAGLIYDTSLVGNTRKYFDAAAEKYGISKAGAEEFTIFSADYGSQLQRLHDAGGNCLFVWGASDNTAGIVKGLADLGADYVDRDASRRASPWRPHLLGWPGGTGEKKWAELAGDAAKVGTMTAWYLGGLVGGPEFAVRDWLAAAGRQAPSGGEETPANGFWALLEAVRAAGTTDRARVVEALEGLQTRFAGLDYGFEANRHLSLTEDELCFITLETYRGPVDTDPPYAPGREWSTTFPEIRPDYIGPVHLVRPTLEANLRAAPDYMRKVLEEGWGTQCTKRPPDALGEDVPMTNDCKIH